jgi:hypothetical protein
MESIWSLSSTDVLAIKLYRNCRLKPARKSVLKEINFEDCYKARVEVDIQGLKINFIDLENLKHNKRATGRPQDFADAENLE